MRCLQSNQGPPGWCRAEWTGLGPFLGSGPVLITRRLKMMDRQALQFWNMVFPADGKNRDPFQSFADAIGIVFAHQYLGDRAARKECASSIPEARESPGRLHAISAISRRRILDSRAAKTD